MKDAVRDETGSTQPTERRDVPFFIASILAVFVPVFLITLWRGEPLHVLHYTALLGLSDSNVRLGRGRRISRLLVRVEGEGEQQVCVDTGLIEAAGRRTSEDHVEPAGDELVTVAGR